MSSQAGGTASQPSFMQSTFMRVVLRPRITLYLLAAWSLLAALTQLFVNSPLFLDIHDVELDGAIGGLALSFNAVPLALLYLYCSRDPERYFHVFWLSLVHQGAMVLGNLYHLVIGTFSAESIVLPVAGAAFLAGLSFAQIFEPRGHAHQTAQITQTAPHPDPVNPVTPVDPGGEPEE